MPAARLDCGGRACPILSLSGCGDKRVMDQEQQPQHSDDLQAGTNVKELSACLDALLNAFTKGIEDLVQPHGLSVVEYNLLRICMERTECNATDLAEVLPVDAPRISRLVNGLVEKGLITRRRLRDDRRIVMLRLSEQGQELASTLRLRINAYDTRLSEGIGEEEMRVFVSMAAKMLANHAGSKEA